jgi:hypothetical protein
MKWMLNLQRTNRLKINKLQIHPLVTPEQQTPRLYYQQVSALSHNSPS